MRKLGVFVAALVGAGALPASAATFDIGTLGGAFSYAQYDGGTNFTPFTGSCGFGSGCVSGPEGVGHSQVVYDAGSFIVAHPGMTSNTAVLFTAPRTGTYSFDVKARLADLRPEAAAGNGVTLSGYAKGGTVDLGTLTGVGNSRSFAGSILLAKGEAFGLILGNNGNNAYDSTGLSGSLAGAVPEPATWAMMIGGFGGIGGMIRRRRAHGTPRPSLA